MVGWRTNLLRGWLHGSTIEHYELPKMELSWLGNPQIEDELVALVTTKDPKIVFLMETKAENFILDRIGRRIHFANLFFVLRINSGGGLALFWKFDVDAIVQTSSKCHIGVVINQGVDDA